MRFLSAFWILYCRSIATSDIRYQGSFFDLLWAVTLYEFTELYRKNMKFIPKRREYMKFFDVLPQLAENELLKRGVMTDELPLFTDFLWYIIFAKMSAFLFG